MNKRSKKLGVLFMTMLLALSCATSAFAVESNSNGNKNPIVESGSNGNKNPIVESGSNGNKNPIVESGSNGNKNPIVESDSNGSKEPGKDSGNTSEGTISNTTETTSAAAAAKLQNVADGSTNDIGVIAAGSKVGDDVWSIAMKKGLKITLSSNAGAKVTWAFGAIDRSVNFDPAVYVGQDVKAVNKALSNVTLPSTTKYTTVSFAYDGVLPGTATVILDLSSANKFTEGETVYLYYLNPTTGKFELTSTSKYTNGIARFVMTHCSDYIVTNEALPGTIVASSPKTGDSANILFYVLLIVAGGAFVTFYCVKRKKA